MVTESFSGLDSAQLPPSESVYVWFPWVKAKNGTATRGELSNFSHLYSVPLRGKSLHTFIIIHFYYSLEKYSLGLYYRILMGQAPSMLVALRISEVVSQVTTFQQTCFLTVSPPLQHISIVSPTPNLYTCHVTSIIPDTCCSRVTAAS